MITQTAASCTLSGDTIIRAIRAAGIEFVLSVPDITTSDGLLWPIARDPSFRLIRVCKEDEAVGVAAGLWACGKRSVILIQNTGLLYSMNALRAIALEYKQPICLLVGLLLKEEGVPAEQSSQYGVRIIPPLLRVLNLAHHVIETDGDASTMQSSIDAAYDRSHPAAFLIGRSPRP